MCLWIFKYVYADHRSSFVSKVVEIVDRYDDVCLNGTKTERINYIQGSGDKTCTRTLTVSFLCAVFGI